MKKRLGLFFATLLSIVVMPLSPLVVNAMDAANADQPVSSEPSSGPPTTYEIDDKATNTTDFQKKLEERLAARKETLKTNLTFYQQKRIKTRCKAAQGIIVKVSDKAKEAKTSRDQIYTNVLDGVTALQARLKESGKDTTKLDANIVELKSLVDTFKTDLKDLRQSASDITSMDCTTDPSSFKASLEALRTDRETVVKDSQAIRAYIKDMLKPTLKEIRDSIDSTKMQGEAN